MSNATGLIQFDHLGIGRALANNRLRVPLNQREYSWEEDEVRELIQDFQRAIKNGTYFLGSIVLTKGDGGLLEVADGQQRLATVTVLLAAIRDDFHFRKDEFNANSLDNEFLLIPDRVARKQVPRLTLNAEDSEFFRKVVLERPDTKDRETEPTRRSHKLILKARELARKHIQTLTRDQSERGKTEELLHWIDFLSNGAQVILLTVPDHLDAFRLFETLNDRGREVSEADLLKNYLLSESGKRLQEAQHKWATMVGTIESVGDEGVLLVYLRHLLVTRYGAIRRREVYDKIKEEFQGVHAAIRFLDDLAENAHYYVALLNRSHPHWNSCGIHATRIRRSVETLRELSAEQIRPLMLACARMFSPTEIEKAFRLFIAWTVRFAIAGSPTGTVEKHYAARATEVWKGEIKTATGLAKEMHKHLPSDEAFKNAFTTARVSKAYFARYLLRSLEQKVKKDPEPELVVNDDQMVLTLEHILPQNPGSEWGDVDADEAEAFNKRLGNMVLLRASANSKVGNTSFTEKKKAYKASSSLELTKQVLAYEQWGPDEIAERQAKLAATAVETWPITV